MTRPRATTPRRPTGTPGSAFTGTLGLLRLYLRRDRIVLPLWVLLLSVPLASVYVGSIEAVYPTAARPRGVRRHRSWPAPRSARCTGNVYDDSLGATGIWKAGMFHVLIAVAVILTVIRHTRADEETGRAELLDSTAVGRYASLTAALLLAGGASILTGVIGTAGLLTLDVPPPGSLAFGSALACSGLVFTAVAAVTAQLSPSARFARGVAFGVLGVRASPCVRSVTPARTRRPVVVLAAGLVAAGASVRGRPVLGAAAAPGDHGRVGRRRLPAAAPAATSVAGLIAERPGAPAAAGPLRGHLRPGVAAEARLADCCGRSGCASTACSSAAWSTASATRSAAAPPRHRQSARRNRRRWSRRSSPSRSACWQVAAAAFAISLTLRLHQEETTSAPRRCSPAQSAGSVGWQAISCSRSSAAGGDPGRRPGRRPDLRPPAATSAASCRPCSRPRRCNCPRSGCSSAVTVALFGLLPRFTPVAWGVLVAFIAVYLLGSLANSPQWLLDLEPFTHAQRTPGQPFDAAPVIWLLLIDGVLLAIGLLAFRRRDLR